MSSALLDADELAELPLESDIEPDESLMLPDEFEIEHPTPALLVANAATTSARATVDRIIISSPLMNRMGASPRDRVISIGGMGHVL